jgi:putative sugar O-methyltransferase
MINTDKENLWEHIFKSKKFNNVNLDTFKNNNGANTKISQYNYKTHGLFFLKNIIFSTAQYFSDDELYILSKIKNRNYGGGVSVKFNHIEVDLDYLMALEEILFMKDILSKTESILEIGAGYGRTCHSILSVFPNIKNYYICDLPKTLLLSNSYLKQVNDDVNKISFISNEDMLKRHNLKFDLIINIDSFQEMDVSCIKDYFAYIDERAHFFYTKNTIGKFTPELCGFNLSKASVIAMKMGLLTKSIDIFDFAEVKKAQLNFLQNFVLGEKWKVIKHASCRPWSHYYQALYEKNT